MHASLKTTWPAFYYDGRLAARRQAQVTITGSGLHIALPDGASLLWSYEQIRQTQGFYPGEPVRLENAGAPDEAIVVPEREFLEAVHQISPLIGAGMSAPESRAVWLRNSLLAGAAAVVVGLGAYFYGIPALAEVAASRVPVQWEERLGEDLVGKFAPSEMRCASPEQTKALEQILTTLTEASPQSPYTFRVTVLDHSTANAFAAPGGHIVLYRGLLKETRNAEELAGVMAHEIQHISHRHSTKAIFRELSMKLLLASLVGDSGSLNRIVEGAGTMGGLRYRRGDEAEADRDGIKMLLAARVDSQGLIELLARMGKESKDAGLIPEYFSTHPATAERIQQIQRVAGDSSETPRKLLPDYPWPKMAEICAGRK